MADADRFQILVRGYRGCLLESSEKVVGIQIDQVCQILNADIFGKVCLHIFNHTKDPLILQITDGVSLINELHQILGVALDQWCAVIEQGNAAVFADQLK